MQTTWLDASRETRMNAMTLFEASFGSIHTKPSCEKSTSHSAGSSR